MVVVVMMMVRDCHMNRILYFPANGGWSPLLCFIRLGHFYSASSSPLLLRGAPGTARILCRSFTPKRHRQLQVKDLPKVPTWRLEQYSNPRPFGRKATNLPMSHHAPIPFNLILENLVCSAALVQ